MAKKSSIKKINNLINRINEHDKNKFEGIFLSESLTEFFLLKDEIHIPNISVIELDYKTGYTISKYLADILPEYLFKHNLLEDRKPMSEQYSLHFIKTVPGRIIDFIHIMKFNFKFTGGHGRIKNKGDNITFPEYNTDRINYKSRLVPVPKNSDPYMMESIKLKSLLEIDSSTSSSKYSAVFFDEFSPAEISLDFNVKAGEGIYSISPKIYPFLFYDYLTLCMNIPDPTADRLERAAEIFEPLFIYLYNLYRGDIHFAEKSEITIFDRFLDFSDSDIGQKELFKDNLKKYFSCYSIFRDEELMLKGLRKIIINE
ncbi:MAG: hypothetical protein FWH53_07025 [Leptospirales bacterium]|nr:hypothetical protein [Leptospirales bacterium]